MFKPTKRMRHISLTVPKGLLIFRPIPRMRSVATKQDRKMNQLVVMAIFQFLEREESGTPYKFSAKTPKEGPMPRKVGEDKLSIYIPQKKIGEKPVERLMKVGEKKDRSINSLVVEAILQYLDREENRQ
jgi:predicted transcriptional regulator